MKRSIGWLCAIGFCLGLSPGSALAGDEAPSAQHPRHDAAVRSLESDEVAARRRGTMELAESGEMGDVPVLLDALGDADSLVRTGAERAIWSIWSRSGDAEVDRLFAEGADHLANRRLSDSVAVFSRIIELKPDFAEGWNKRATALFLAGDLDASAADCDEVLKRNPSHFGALSGYGLIALQQGRLEQALLYFERALALNPNMAGVRANIEAIRESLGRRGRQET
ncbi:MAG: tetratricopeptide repeat protein [Casimicrobiaceae bacterium]